ncbi:MotE family protein [Nitratireductor mangrovi]|uniref:MotE family protein n=1 Tax=Nitratireductor mangrovi TaxID=2599600 RepID=A0A5B8L4D6_9HYPH|nr:MotE family protein [Nitratireductor mangrovi]QDZ02704.1 MotE family protein [Nitratireductor mangrovi]
MPQRRFTTDRRRAKQGLLAIAFAGLCFASGAFAVSDSFAQARKVPTRLTDEVREFCANIIDAARDRRYAVQAQELEKLRTEIDDRIAALEAKRAEYEDWLKRREQVIDSAEDSIVGIYARMRPDAAAERLEKMDAMLAAAIVLKLNHRQAGVILNEMEARAAARLTSIIADVAKSENPT